MSAQWGSQDFLKHKMEMAKGVSHPILPVEPFGESVSDEEVETGLFNSSALMGFVLGALTFFVVSEFGGSVRRDIQSFVYDQMNPFEEVETAEPRVAKKSLDSQVNRTLAKIQRSRPRTVRQYQAARRVSKGSRTVMR